MNPWLNYHHLAYFRSIAREGSLVAASKKLGLGAPALSAQLKTLEQTLGVALFDRKNRRLELTEHGRIVLEYANEIFRSGEELLQVLQDAQGSRKSQVRIGALDNVPKHFISALVRAALEIQDCSVTVVEGRADDLIRELSLHRLNLVLANHKPPSAEGVTFFSHPIGRDPVVICASKKTRLLRRNFPSCLKGQKFVLPARPNRLRDDVEQWFHRHNLEVSVVAETQDTAVQKILGADGVGLIAVAKASVQDSIRRGELIELGSLDGVEEEVYLLSASRKIENPIAAELMKSFRIEH